MNLSSDDYVCTRCNRAYKWELLTTTRAGNLLCSECSHDLSNEPLRKCPVDSTEMTKRRVLDKFLIDQCPECDGIWFDKGELKLVQQAAKDAGENEGIAKGFLFGMITG